MALYKEIEHIFDGNDIPYSYHRIVTVTSIVNLHNVIEVHSYRTKERRDVEKEEINSGSAITVHKDVKYITMPYTQNNVIIAAYNYLKTLPEFEGSEDI